MGGSGSFTPGPSKDLVLRKQHEKGPSLLPLPPPPPPHGSQSWGRRPSSRPPGPAPWLWAVRGPARGQAQVQGLRWGQAGSVSRRDTAAWNRAPARPPARPRARTGAVCHLIYAPTRLVSALGPAPHHQLRGGHRFTTWSAPEAASPSQIRVPPPSLWDQTGHCCPGAQLTCTGPVPV